MLECKEILKEILVKEETMRFFEPGSGAPAPKTESGDRTESKHL